MLINKLKLLNDLETCIDSWKQEMNVNQYSQVKLVLNIMTRYLKEIKRGDFDAEPTDCRKCIHRIYVESKAIDPKTGKLSEGFWKCGFGNGRYLFPFGSTVCFNFKAAVGTLLDSGKQVKLNRLLTSHRKDSSSGESPAQKDVLESQQLDEALKKKMINVLKEMQKEGVKELDALGAVELFRRIIDDCNDNELQQLEKRLKEVGLLNTEEKVR